MGIKIPIGILRLLGEQWHEFYFLNMISKFLFMLLNVYYIMYEFSKISVLEK